MIRLEGSAMIYRGKVQGGVVILESGAALPEGAEVIVTVTGSSDATATDIAPTIGQKLVALARRMESQPCDLPSDLAANHDYYLHGLPKRT